MKKIMTLILFSAGLLLSACQPYDDAPIRGKIDDIDGRVRTLEEKVGQLNTNISSMKTILDALQSNDYVTSVTPLLVGGKEVGYTITFTKSKPVTIYHGTDGASGKDGTNGKVCIDRWRLLVHIL